MNAIAEAAFAPDTALTSADPMKGERIGVELLYTPAESIFAAAAPDMVANGWSVMPQEVNRQPGSVMGGRIQWSKEHDLKNRRPSEDTLDLWCAHCSTLNVACVFGPASGNTFAIDIDVLDEAMAAEITAVADQMLGWTPLRREGRFPKLALIYRHAADHIVPSTSRWIADGQGGASEHGIEIQGEGKLLTFHGRHHRTGAYFRWLDQNPMIVGPEAAPLVSAEMVEQFLGAVDALHGFADSGADRTFSSEGRGTWSADGVCRRERCAETGGKLHWCGW